jgi:hypothetical protein
MRIGMGEKICKHPIVAHVAWSYHQHLPTYVHIYEYIYSHTDTHAGESYHQHLPTYVYVHI